MKCNKCRNKLAREWRFCPYCGLRIERVNSFLESFEQIFKSLFSGQRGQKFSQPKNKFTIRIKTGDKEQVISNIKPKSQVRISAKPKPIKMPKELIEPEANVKRRGDELEITIELPGVKSLSDVNLMNLGESLELRAVKDDKGYFKIISVPAGYRIINKSLNDEILSVRLAQK